MRPQGILLAHRCTTWHVSMTTLVAYDARLIDTYVGMPGNALTFVFAFCQY
jgi:hypothetical protein